MHDELWETVNEARREGYLEGHAVGLQEGIETGLHEGSLVAMRALLLRIVQHQYGDVPADIRTAISEQGHLETLSQWVTAVWQSNSMHEFKDRVRC